jgi:hypothetical protein
MDWRAVIIVTQILFTASDLLARNNMPKSGFIPYCLDNS